MNRYELFIPGPVQMSPPVCEALARPMIPHYGPDWVEGVYRPVVEALGQVFQTRGDVVVVPGSGSGAIDAAFCSLADPARTVAILRNGFFGDRLLAIARHYFPNVVDCSVPCGEPITAETAEEFLTAHPVADIVAVVHGETSTGVANDIEAIARAAKRRPRVLIVDAVSTLGAVDLPVDRWGIDLCVSASQKGVSGPPGLGFVSVGEPAYSFMPPRDRIPGWYHNLRMWKDAVAEWGAWHPYPVTLPVNLFFALHVALAELLGEGLSACFQRHRRTAEHVRSRLREMGAEMYCRSGGFELDTVTAFTLPAGFKSPDLLAYLRDRRGMLITGGHPGNKDRMSRIGHMGYAARPETMDRVLDGVAEFLKRA